MEHDRREFIGFKLQKHKLVSNNRTGDGDDYATRDEEKLLPRQSDAVVLDLLRKPLRFFHPALVRNCAENLEWLFRLVIN